MDPLDALRSDCARFGYGFLLGVGGEGASFAPPEHALLVVGPPRCGKTSSVVVPNIVSACGPVVTTSTKADLLYVTAPPRSRVGDCFVFDPSGRAKPPPGGTRVGWSPLDRAADWDRAVLTAEAMVLSARPGSDRGEGYHWSERAQALLAPAFHAAALEEMGMARLLSLVDRRQGRQIMAALSRHDCGIPLDTFEGVLETEERELSGIWSTASSVLSAYRSEAALASSGERPVDLAAFVRSGDTLYVTCGADEQRHAAPIVSGLLRDARLAGYEAAAAGELGPAHRRPPLLFVLDEVANIAPLHDLPALVAEGGGQGVMTLACLQDLSQAQARWGRLGEGFLSLFNTKLVFPGIGDRSTLEALSLLGGEGEVGTVSVSEGRPLSGLPGLLGRRAPPQLTLSQRREPRLPPDAVARGHSGQVLCLDGAVPSFVSVRPWFEDRRLAGAVLGREIGDLFERPAPGPRHLRGLAR